MKVAIIGTAGRKEDAAKMNKDLYLSMYRYMLEQLVDLDEVHLVSGGAAWSDHIAVAIWNRKPANVRSLTLHLPCEFSRIVSCFDEDNKAGSTANYYHYQMGKKLANNESISLIGIEKAIETGAHIIVKPGFHCRNASLAASLTEGDKLYAFTWGCAVFPKDGGTLHTWNCVTNPGVIKTHIPLETL